MPLQQALTPDSVVAGEDLLIRVGSKWARRFASAARTSPSPPTVLSEPDRISGSLNIGLRMMMSREALERTGLMQIGSRSAQRFSV